MATALKNLLSTFIRQDNDWKTKLLAEWPAIMGNLHDKVNIEKIEDSTLTLGVFDSCWTQELYMLSNVLLRSINQKLDQPRIKQLRFKKAGIKKPSAVVKRTPHVRSNKIVELNSREKKALEQIKDDGLQSAIKQCFIRCYQEK